MDNTFESRLTLLLLFINLFTKTCVKISVNKFEKLNVVCGRLIVLFCAWFDKWFNIFEVILGVTTIQHRKITHVTENTFAKWVFRRFPHKIWLNWCLVSCSLRREDGSRDPVITAYLLRTSGCLFMFSGYLAEEQLMTAYDEFLEASPYLDAFRNEYDRIFMTSLKNVLAEYRAVKIYGWYNLFIILFWSV